MSHGGTDTLVKKIVIPYHILGAAKGEITYIDKENIDMVLALEMADFTLSEYIRDTNMLTKSKTILSFGHFNLEEHGMKYMTIYLHEQSVQIKFHATLFNHVICIII